MNVKQDNEYLSLYSSDDGLDDIDEPVTKASLDVIMCEVSTIGSTWADLRKQYSPKQPAFEPLSFNTITWAAFAKAGTTGLDNDIVVDEAYSQAATMVAYGVELLRVALSGPEIHRSRIIKVGNMLTTLCASLSDTRDQHRVVLSKMLVDKVNAYRRSQGMSVDIESEAINSLAKIRSPGNSRLCRQARRGGKSAARERNHPYRREHRHSEATQQLHDCGTAQMIDPATSTFLPTRLPCIGNGREISTNMENVPLAPLLSILSDSGSTPRESVGGTDITSATDSTAAVAVVPQISRQVELPAEFGLQSVVRDGLLSQGLLESAITEYLHEFRKCTNHNDDLMWKAWVKWCVAKGKDPRRRTNGYLNDFISGINGAAGSKAKARPHIKVVWSIVEGHPLPGSCRPRANHARY